MIAISSHRPHSEGDSYRINQIRAKDSWERIFNRIIYFGPRERELESPKTYFINSDQFPRIKDMTSVAGQQYEVVALINADIIVSDRIREIDLRIRRGNVAGAISRRHHYDPQTFDLNNAKDDPKDRGRDIFMALPGVWRAISAKIPSAYRIGHQKWDAFVSDYFRDNFGPRFNDFTNLRCIFHPIHEDRKMPHAQEVETL